MPNDRTDDRAVRLVVKNGTKFPSRLILKHVPPPDATPTQRAAATAPGGFYDMAAGESYEVRARGPAAGTLTVEQVEGGSIVAGWPGCLLSVHTLKRLGGERIEPISRADAPTVGLLRRMWALRGHGDVDEDDEETLV